MEAGKLNKLVTIEEKTVLSDGYAGNETVYLEYDKVWAAIRPLKGNNLYRAQEIDNKVTTKIIIRYIDGLKPDWRIIYGNVQYRIAAILNLNSGDKTIELLCEDLISERGSGQVEQPTITSPMAGQEDFPAAGPINGSDFAMASGSDTHRATKWQIAAAADTNYSSPLVDILTTVDLTSLALPADTLTAETSYIVRVKYIGSLTGSSTYSISTTFTTAA